VDQGARHRHPLTLTARQHGRPVPCAVRQSDRGQQAPSPIASVRALQTRGHVVEPARSAALESGRGDAWSIWDPDLAAFQEKLGVRVLADDSHLPSTNSVYESSRSFALKWPGVVGLTLQELAAVGAWANGHAFEVARLLAPQLGLPVNVVRTWQRPARSGVRPVDVAVIQTRQRVADPSAQDKLIAKTIDVGSAVRRLQRS